MKADPDVAFGVGTHPARNRICEGSFVLIDFPCRRIEASDAARIALGKPNSSITRNRHAVALGALLGVHPIGNGVSDEFSACRIQSDDVGIPGSPDLSLLIDDDRV